MKRAAPRKTRKATRPPKRQRRAREATPAPPPPIDCRAFTGSVVELWRIVARDPLGGPVLTTHVADITTVGADLEDAGAEQVTFRVAEPWEAYGARGRTMAFRCPSANVSWCSTIDEAIRKGALVPVGEQA